MSIVENRIKRWKDKLIDLTKRNRLLNFRPTKVTTIKIIDELPSEVFKIVAIDNTTMEFRAIPSKEDVMGDDADEMHNESEHLQDTQEFQPYKRDDLVNKYVDKYLQTNLEKKDLQRNLFRIYSKASSVMEEQGYNVLFLALGCLEWYEAEQSDVKLKAPVILIPVELSRRSVKSSFTLKYTEEAPMLNPALVQKLQNDFGIVLQIDDSGDDFDTQKVFKELQEAVKKWLRWRVTNDIYLSLFSFAKFVMYKDIEKFMQSCMQNPIIKAICGLLDKDKGSLGLSWESEDIEKSFSPLKTFQVLDADSSQQKAILAVKKGSSILIEGPPGTGKSQTIANIIAEALSEHKKVLFVSQKMAALEVVKKRLEYNGLGDFCLELHSHKTNKSEVIKELVRALDIQDRLDHSHDEDLLKLEEIRNNLNAYVRALHAPCGSLGMTPYQAFGIISLCSCADDLGYLFDNINQWDKKKFTYCYELMGRLAHCLEDIHDPNKHPWNGSKITELNYEHKVKLNKIICELSEAYSVLKDNFNNLAKALHFTGGVSTRNIRFCLDTIDFFQRFTKPAKLLLNDNRWHTEGNGIQEIIAAVQQFRNLKYSLSVKYDPVFIDLDIEKLLVRYRGYSNFFKRCLPTYWKDRGIFRKYKRDNKYKPKLEQIISDLEMLNQGKNAAVKLDEKSEFAANLFGDTWRGRDSDIEHLRALANWMEQFRWYANKNYFSPEFFDDSIRVQLEDNLKNNIRIGLCKFEDILRSFLELSKLDGLTSFGLSIDSVMLDEINAKAVSMKQCIDDLDVWLRYQNTLKACEEEGVKDFIDKIPSWSISSEKIADAFKAQFLRCWMSFAFSQNPALSKFYGEDHERLIEKFRDLDMKQMVLAKVRLQHMLSGKVDTSWEASSGSELGILRRESRKQRALMPLRRLFMKIPHIMLELKPCLMMSPLTVSQFIDPSLMRFDLVIFDEASQIPPEDSIGSIMRGKQVVIAGDGKQLPPTSFFQSEVMTAEDEDAAEDALPQDLSSILDECVSINFPRTMLRWHYRSRHESLIAFSNKYFYDNNLNTFPSAEEESSILGLKFNYVPNASYDRGGSGTNREEAKTVAKAVFEHFRHHPQLSLGVGTFSIRQKYAIEDVIEEMLKEDSSLEHFFMKEKQEHFFIKNLEIIQGDERDVIFISVGYGKDCNGKLSMNFGPINKEGGQRRLNVLVTRARHRLEIFSSIKGDDFDLSKTESSGVHLLKKYLDFAEKGKSILFEDVKEAVAEFSESPFEEAIYIALQAKGIKVKKQVGCSGYRIDLAVIDEANPGRYILGIECDGANYHSSVTARDRDRLRQQVLEGLGWAIHRVWSTDWFKNRNRELDKLINAIELAKTQESKKKLKIQDSYEIQYKHSNKTAYGHTLAQVTQYSITPIRSKRQSADFYSASTNTIAEVVYKVVVHEGPIHRDELIRRVANFWGMNSTKSRIKDIVESAGQYCVDDQAIVVKDDFYWPIEMEVPPVRSRDVDEVSNDIELISLEEIGEAALIALKKEYSMPEEELVRQVGFLLGIRRVADSVSVRIRKGIEQYIEEDKIINFSDKLIFNKLIDEKITEELEVGQPRKAKITKIIPKTVGQDLQISTEKETIESTKSKKQNFSDIIKSAITHKEKLSIEYKSPYKGWSKRTINPFEFDGKYIKAYCYLAKDNRNFRVDRIQRIEVIE